MAATRRVAEMLAPELGDLQTPEVSSEDDGDDNEVVNTRRGTVLYTGSDDAATPLFSDDSDDDDDDDDDDNDDGTPGTWPSELAALSLLFACVPGQC